MIAHRHLWNTAALTVLALLVAFPAVAQCPSAAPDLPDECPCAGPSQNWPLPATPLDVFDTALELAGMSETCDPDRGQPYWQIQRNYSASQDVLASLNALSGFGTAAFPAPRAWSSEFVAHVFAQAGVPYAGGFRSPWSATDYPRTPQQLIEWFETEELLPQLIDAAARFFPRQGSYEPVARGQWIDGTELDLGFFIPGLTGPCPGAVQIVDAIVQVSGSDVWSDSARAQIIGDMVVYRSASGKVFRIDAQIIQGDAPSGAVHGDGSPVGAVWVSNLQNLQRYTKLGASPLSVSENRRIRGWGIPFDESGAPLYDPSRITTIQSVDVHELPYDPTGPDPQTELLASPFLQFAQERGGVTVIDKNFGLEQYMPSDSDPWEFPADGYNIPPQVELDLLMEWPRPIRNVTLFWRDGLIPESLTIELEDADGFVEVTTHVQDPQKSAAHKALGDEGRIDLSFDTAHMQKLRLILPKDLPATYELIGLEFEVESGNDDDDQFDPTPTSVLPETNVGSTVVAWADGRVESANGGIEASALIRPGTSAIMRVFDLRGRVLQRIDLPRSNEAEQRVRWDGRDESGRSVARGVYFLRLEAEGIAASKRVMLLR